jgi:hypothetical protein
MILRRMIYSVVLIVLTIPLFAQADKSSAPPGFADGDFFILSSIDLAKHLILLKRPTEVTELIRVESDTRYIEEHGKALRLTDLRAGDTVYILSKLKGGQTIATAIRRGPMTVEVLRERYLKPTNRPQAGTSGVP